MDVLQHVDIQMHIGYIEYSFRYSSKEALLQFHVFRIWLCQLEQILFHQIDLLLDHLRLIFG